ncbi:helix-turn-helix transcriptional regulator [Streptomyces sp. PTM05]|uniref:Helix-turn-helix transcriptional regulator n=1 Tax=Streptantibioticus parmotrematis TaxID=2873249 RepID=A0ABS7QYT5_9ACTN|nr:helix-turn-helix transcriptional regulator [Streptantibioticus parmotrematis]MBY8886949.1 helix-turn-helix transcriptional regulator [Streptantibioticus parmotrematis]
MTAAPGEAGLRRILAVVDLLIDAVDEETLLPALLPSLLRTVPGDSLVWSVRPYLPGEPVVSLPRDLLSPRELAAFAAHRARDPLVAHTTVGSGVPMRRSDLQTRAETRRLGAYAEVYRPIGAEYQLAMAFPAGRGPRGRRSVCCVVNRSARDFDDADLAAAALLRSRLSHALTRLSTEPDPPTAPRGAGDGITPREAAVLDLLARGLTDRQISHRLGVSPRTVDKHLEHAYPKLGAHGRVEAATRWLHRRPPP